MSLYLKYRPQDFKSVVGQDHAVTTIRNAIKHETLTHAYLFSGPRGTGKTSLARIIAKALNCLQRGVDGEPCNKCSICTGVNEGRLVDMIEIDAASNRGIDEIRELKEKIVFAPNQARTKVYIIDEVHMLTKEAFNALLKTLEEPPSHAYFILATTEVHKIPETIISRCQQFNFKRINQESTVKRLQMIADEEHIEADMEALSLIAKIANGGLRDAIGLFEQMSVDGSVRYNHVAENLGLSSTVFIEKFFQHLLERKALKAIEIINQVNAKGHNLYQFASEVIAFLREQMLINLENSKETETIVGFIDIFSEAKLQMNQAFIPQLPLEVAVIRACKFDIISDKEIPLKKAEAKEEAAPKAKAKEKGKEEKPPLSGGEITLGEIKENWQRIIDNIETPFIRMSFMDGEPVKFENKTLHMAFSSATLMDKIDKTSNQADVLKALEKVFESKISLKLDVKKVNLSTDKPKKDVPSGIKGEKKAEPSVIEMAKEVFGMKSE
jgi:DNA polymerase-3 subunit gamma/tau